MLEGEGTVRGGAARGAVPVLERAMMPSSRDPAAQFTGGAMVNPREVGAGPGPGQPTSTVSANAVMLGVATLVKSPRGAKLPNHVPGASQNTLMFRLEDDKLIASDLAFNMTAHTWTIGAYTSLEVVDVGSGGDRWCVAVHCSEGDVRVGVVGNAALQHWQNAVTQATGWARNKVGGSSGVGKFLPLGAQRRLGEEACGTQVTLKPFSCPTKVMCEACRGSGKSKLNVRHACGKCGGEGFAIHL